MEETRLGSYELVARLGIGGMAEVYLARRSGAAGFTKYVAIKRMRPDLTSHQEFVDLFAEEAKTASALSHPNICQVHEFNDCDGEYYMVMEYLDGVALSSVVVRAMRRRDWPSLPIITGIIEQACHGIHYAHDLEDESGSPLNIIHRDVSPPNLLITRNGVVKLFDFGISKSRQSVVRTVTGQIRGKFSYMSPEQLQSRTLDRRSDIFSLGIVLYELVTGVRLFRRPSRLQVYHAITAEPVKPASQLREDLPSALDAVIRRALARDRDERYSTAQDMADALRRASESFDGPASAQGLAEFVSKHFSAELESRRQLFTDPSAHLKKRESNTGPTISLRGPFSDGETVSDATVPGHVQTGAATFTALGVGPVGPGSDADDSENSEAGTDEETEGKTDNPATP